MSSIFAGMSLCGRLYRHFSAVSYPYPLPRDLLSGSAPRSDLMSNADRRPYNLNWAVGLLLYLKDLDTAAEYARLAYSRFRNCDSTNRTCDYIISAMCETKRYRDALDLYNHFFNELKMKATCTSSGYITKALCDLNRVDDALVLFHADYHIRDRITSCSLTKALVHAGRFDEALYLLRRRPLPMAFTNLIRGFLNLGNLDMANQLLEEFECRQWFLDFKSQLGMGRVVFIEHWLKQGKDDEAMRLYLSLISNNKFEVSGDTGNGLLQVFLRNGKKTEAWELFHRMLDHTKVGSETIDIMVSECFKEGRFREGIDTFYKVKAKVESLGVDVYRNVITKCCEQGMLTDAESIYNEFWSDRCLLLDVSICRAMMDAYVKAGRVDDALKMANSMVDENLKDLALFMYC